MSTAARLLIHPVRDVTVVNFQDASILDTVVVDEIGRALYELVDAQARRKLILDFSNVKFLSSSALGVLITLKKKSSAIKGEVVLCSMRPELKKVFEITNLSKMFNFCEDENKALGHYGITVA